MKSRPLNPILLLLFCSTFAWPILGEELKPRRREVPRPSPTAPRVNPQPSPALAPRTPTLIPRRQERVVRPTSPTVAPPDPTPQVESAPTSLSILLLTPLFKTDVYDARFSTFGLEILSSIPLFTLTDYVPFFIEFGPGFTYSKLSLSQPAVTFSHMYFFLPLHLRTQLVLGKSNIRLDLMAGLQIRPFEYDSRDTTDGGFRSTGSFFGSIDPDIAAGLVIPMGESYRLRAYVGYLKMAVGLESLF